MVRILKFIYIDTFILSLKKALASGWSTTRSLASQQSIIGDLAVLVVFPVFFPCRENCSMIRAFWYARKFRS